MFTVALLGIGFGVGWITNAIVTHAEARKDIRRNAREYQRRRVG